MGAAPGYLIKLLERRHDGLGLALAALSLEKARDPTINVSECIDRIVTMASDICQRLPASAATGDVLYAINTHLFDDLKYDRRMGAEAGRAPFLHSLLEGQRGDAVCFVIFYLTLGRLLHLPLEGVSFSGRLLLRVADGGDEDVIDPCGGGVVLTRAELKALFEGVVGGAVESHPPYRIYLEALDDRAVLERLLRCYKAYLLDNGDYATALAVIESILLLSPGDGAVLLERGRLLEMTAEDEAAAAVYFHYLERHPGTPECLQLRQRLRWLLAKRGSLH